ncbi:hypothetical protein [Geopseudomonas aromaticivorans]
MKHRESTNAPGRPDYEGQFVLFRSPHDSNTLLLDVAERDHRGKLGWATVNDPAKIEAAQMAYHAIKDGIPDPCIRTSVVRQHAVNLMLRYFDDIGGDPQRFDNMARGIEVALQNINQGRRAIPFAIEQGLEVDRPYLAEIEEMLALGSALAVGPGGSATTTVPRSCLGVLEDLRAGRDPSGGMFPVIDQLKALQQQYPVLKQVELAPAEPEYVPISDGCMP